LAYEKKNQNGGGEKEVKGGQPIDLGSRAIKKMTLGLKKKSNPPKKGPTRRIEIHRSTRRDNAENVFESKLLLGAGGGENNRCRLTNDFEKKRKVGPGKRAKGAGKDFHNKGLTEKIKKTCRTCWK